MSEGNEGGNQPGEEELARIDREVLTDAEGRASYMRERRKDDIEGIWNQGNEDSESDETSEEGENKERLIEIPVQLTVKIPKHELVVTDPEHLKGSLKSAIDSAVIHEEIFDKLVAEIATNEPELVQESKRFMSEAKELADMFEFGSEHRNDISGTNVTFNRDRFNQLVADCKGLIEKYGATGKDRFWRWGSEAIREYEEYVAGMK